MREPSPGECLFEPLVDALLGASEDPVLILDGSGSVLAANAAAREVLPGPAGGDFLEACGGDARDAFTAALAGQRVSVGAAVGERHLVWRLHPVEGAGAGRARVVAAGRDTAAVIRERRDLFHKVLDALPIGVNIFSVAMMRTFYMNDAFVTIHGWPREIVLDGRALHERTMPDPALRQRVLDQIAADMASGDPARMRWTIIDIVTERGERRHLLAVNTPVRELGLHVGTVQDLTDLWRARTELEQSEQRFRIIAEQTGQVVYDCDLETGRVHWAGAIERVTGFSPAELSGVDRGAWEQLVHPEDRTELQRRRAASIDAGSGCETQYRLRRHDGSYVLIEDSSTVVHDGGVAHLLGRMKDISERIRAEEEHARLAGMLQHAQRMESIGRLAGGVAHDFNNLLTAILGNVSLAQLDRAAATLPERLSEIEQAAESAARLTRQLLAFSRCQVIEPRVLDLGEVLRRLERLLTRTIGEDVELEVVARARGRVRVDVAQLEQIVMNLAVNARDAMPKGGRILIETADVVLDETYCLRHANAAPGPHVLLAVTDSGCGLTEEARAHLFEPFFTTKPQGMGTGLGLATVYGAVRQNGGSVEVDSVPGRGSTFKIYFPRETEPIDALATPAAPPPAELPRGSETILLVEDDPRVGRFASQLLDLLGYQVLATTSAAEALALFRTAASGSIDLLFTDVVLPGMSGRELAETLKTEHGVKRVLFTSGYTDDVIIRHGVLARGIAFLAKPYTRERLAQKVREVLDTPGIA